MQISKAIYGTKPDYVIQREHTTVCRMREGGWFEPPLCPEDIRKHFEVFKTKKHDRAKIIYTILLARANELGGITKITNKQLAAASKKHFKTEISVRQVERSIAYLKKWKLFAVLDTYLPAHVAAKAAGHTFPRRCRVFLVWASFYANRCTPKAIGWSGWKIDPRVECDEWTEARDKIPLKYKINTPMEIGSREGREAYEVKPLAIDWENLYSMGVIDQWMWDKISMFIYGRDLFSYSSKFIDIMGRTEEQMYFKANKDKILKKRKGKVDAAEELRQNLQRQADEDQYLSDLRRKGLA